MKIRKINFCLSIALLSVSLVACAGNNYNRTQTGAVGGAGLGAGLGAIIGSQSGNAGAGVAVGTATGAIAGALLGNSLDQTDRELQQARARNELQSQQIDENRRLLEELKRVGQDAYESPRGIVINLPDVLFNFDSDRLTGPAQATIDDIVPVLQKGSGRRVSVEGHTDSIGPVEYNKRLSLRRAKSVSNALEQRGVSGFRVSVQGYGEGRPIASNNTDAGRARNRRVEVILENR